jgi:hypothetical protein
MSTFLCNGLSLRRFLIAICVVLVASTTRAAVAQTLEPLEGQLKAAGYQLYKPPRSNWGPGFVFTGDIAGDRIIKVEEVCPNLYDIEAPQASRIDLGNYSAEGSFSLGLAIRFLKALLGVDLNVDQVEREHKVAVKWRNLREFSFSHMDQWLESGQPRPIAKKCSLAIDDLKAKNQFADRVFVIVRAVAPESLVYDFSESLTTQGSASAQLLQGVKANAQVKGQMKDGTHLEISQFLFVGYAPPVKLKDWLPTGQVSGDIVKVRGVQSNLTIE